jgi:exopolysaccharide biosynthesis polyprenyl glycosylphosphotransferase
MLPPGGGISPLMSSRSENPKAPALYATRTESIRFGLLGGRLPQSQIALDAAALVVATLLAYLGTRSAGGSVPMVWLIAFPVLAAVFLSARKSHSRTLRPHVLDEVRWIVSRTAFAAMIALSLRAAVETGSGAAGPMARQWLLTAVLLSGARVVPAVWQFNARERGLVGIPTLIIGAGHVGQLVAKRLRQYPELGLRPIGFLDDAPIDDQSSGIPVLGGLASFDRVAHQFGTQRVIVAFSPASHQELLGVIRRCQQLGVEASFVPRLFETMKERVGIEFVGSLPLVAIDPTNPRGWRFSVKYALDRLLSALLLILVAPVLAALAIAVWISLGRPILFVQRRVGRDGREFDMVKFRTMNGRHAAGPEDLPPDTAPGGVEGDDRRTKVGRFLRRTSLDELPQLINVVRGEMSLVGPRPERPEFAERFEQSVHRYAERQRVKAGITGWAQIHGLRGKTSLADRAEWDNYYIDNWSLWLDFKILVLTIFAVARFQAE